MLTTPTSCTNPTCVAARAVCCTFVASSLVRYISDTILLPRSPSFWSPWSWFLTKCQTLTPLSRSGVSMGTREWGLSGLVGVERNGTSTPCTEKHVCLFFQIVCQRFVRKDACLLKWKNISTICIGETGCQP